jgi:hypothetical protein
MKNNKVINLKVLKNILAYLMENYMQYLQEYKSCSEIEI